MKALHIVTFILVIVGALNWGLVGLFDFNLVNALLKTWPFVEKAAYVLVGLSALVLLFTHGKDCRMCTMKS